MNLRLLGLGAMLGAPFLLIHFVASGIDAAYDGSAFNGLCLFLYTSGWMCSIAGLWHLEAAGADGWGRMVLLAQLLFLFGANLSNGMLLLQTGIHTRLYVILDLFWTISHIWMLVTAVTVFNAGRLRVWIQFVPLLVAFWLPVALFFSIILGGTPQSMLISGLYATISGLLLGSVVFRLQPVPQLVKAYAVS